VCVCVCENVYIQVCMLFTNLELAAALRVTDVPKSDVCKVKVKAENVEVKLSRARWCQAGARG
jgi:hypothetical protein